MSNAECRISSAELGSKTYGAILLVLALEL